MTTPVQAAALSADFFWPFPSSVNGLWRGSVRNETRRAEIIAERQPALAAARAWRDAALADGWASAPTYPREAEDRAFTLNREGFKLSGIARPGDERWLPTASMSMWAPDGLAVRVPRVYPGMVLIRTLATTCSACGASDVPTFRYSFAGRSCAACLPAMKAEHEKPGWCD